MSKFEKLKNRSSVKNLNQLQKTILNIKINQEKNFENNNDNESEKAIGLVNDKGNPLVDPTIKTRKKYFAKKKSYLIFVENLAILYN